MIVFGDLTICAWHILSAHKSASANLVPITRQFKSLSQQWRASCVLLFMIMLHACEFSPFIGIVDGYLGHKRACVRCDNAVQHTPQVATLIRFVRFRAISIGRILLISRSAFKLIVTQRNRVQMVLYFFESDFSRFGRNKTAPSLIFRFQIISRSISAQVSLSVNYN